MKKILFLIIIAALIVIGIYSGWSHYNNTYVSHTAFAVVPNKIPRREKLVDSNGEIVANQYSYKYQLKFVQRNGKITVLTYKQVGKNPKPLTQKSIVRASISKKGIQSGPFYVHAGSVSPSIDAKLNSVSPQ